MKMEKILKAMCGDVWLIHPDKLEAIAEVLNVRLAGGAISGDAIEAVKAMAKENVSLNILPENDVDEDISKTVRNVAVITLYGTLAQRTGAFDSGAVSVERFSKHFDAAMADPSVGSIVLDIDSPGGSVYGIEEMAEKIYKARGKKKVVAVANSFAASGAYWIGAAADDLVVTPSGEIGSIGVVCLHRDLSGAYEQIGVVNTIIKAGKFKIEANPFEALNDDAKEYIQQRVNTTYDVFTKAIAKFRGVGVAEVRKDFGQGRMKLAKAAVASNMADAVGTLEMVIMELQKNKNKSFGARAADRSELTETETDNLGVEQMETTEKPDEANVEAITAEAVNKTMAAEKERVAGLKAAFPDDAAYAMAQVEAGTTVQEAKAAYCDVLTERLKTAQEKKPETAVEAEGAEAIEGAEAGSEGGGGDFHEQAKAKAKDENTTYRVAASALAHDQPDLHAAYAASHRK